MFLWSYYDHHYISHSYSCITQYLLFFNLLLTECLVKQVVNLIPFNPIGSVSQFRTSSDDKVSSFQKILRGSYNIRTTVRKQMGQDISGACGQLVVNLPDKISAKSTPPVTDIEDLCIR